jgi:hypothetical protein
MYQQTHIQHVKYYILFVHVPLLHVSVNVAIFSGTMTLRNLYISSYRRNNINSMPVRYSLLKKVIGCGFLRGILSVLCVLTSDVDFFIPI